MDRFTPPMRPSSDTARTLGGADAGSNWLVGISSSATPVKWREIVSIGRLRTPIAGS
jgi:hypothetical protein